MVKFTIGIGTLQCWYLATLNIWWNSQLELGLCSAGICLLSIYGEINWNWDFAVLVSAYSQYMVKFTIGIGTLQCWCICLLSIHMVKFTIGIGTLQQCMVRLLFLHQSIQHLSCTNSKKGLHKESGILFCTWGFIKLDFDEWWWSLKPHPVDGNILTYYTIFSGLEIFKIKGNNISFIFVYC